MEITVKPFPVPEKVFITLPGSKRAKSFRLADMTKEDLDDMCKDFRDTVMLEAGYDDNQ